MTFIHTKCFTFKQNHYIHVCDLNACLLFSPERSSLSQEGGCERQADQAVHGEGGLRAQGQSQEAPQEEAQDEQGEESGGQGDLFTHRHSL